MLAAGKVRTTISALAGGVSTGRRRPLARCIWSSRSSTTCWSCRSRSY